MGKSARVGYPYGEGGGMGSWPKKIENIISFTFFLLQIFKFPFVLSYEHLHC